MTLVYNGQTKKIKLYDDTHKMIFEAECRNETVASNAWRFPDAGCPPGVYNLSAPSPNAPGHDQTSMGPIFIPVNDIPGHSGIGIHGGGSCVYPNSMEPEQGWCPTENCFRMQNRELLVLAGLLPHGGATFIVFQTE